MSRTIFRILLLSHTVIAGLAGLYFYIAPVAAAALWPWALPPLAARFVGSLLLGGAVCSALTALDSSNIAAKGISLIGIGDGLITLTGLRYSAQVGIDTKFALWLIVFGGAALLLILTPLWVTRQSSSESTGTPTTRLVRSYFTLHLIVVALVGSTMFFLPVRAQPLWPWMMSVVNVRLIGAFFVGAALYSIWCLRQKTWETIRPTMALYAVFATAALIASFIHFNLLNPARVTTWAFVVLYAFVGAGAWYFLWRFGRRIRRVQAAPEPYMLHPK